VADDLSHRRRSTVGDALINNRTVTFVGDRYSVRDGETSVGELSYKIDATKSPAWIDAAADGSEAGIGIIRLEGDTMTFCMKIGGPRPDAFKSEPGDERLLATFKRVKK
jgi:uncharacterized protein (TIGR03067 family)